MEEMADLVDSLLLGLDQITMGAEGVLLEEEADLVARGEEVVVANVLAGGAGAELGHGVRGEVERGEKMMGLGEEGGDGLGVEGVGDDEVAVVVEGVDLVGRETYGGRRHGGRLTKARTELKTEMKVLERKERNEPERIGDVAMNVGVSDR